MPFIPGKSRPGLRTFPGSITPVPVPGYPGLWPGTNLYPDAGFPFSGNNGNPSGIDESAWWATTDTSRPLGLQWLAVSLTTGKLLAELPTLNPAGPVKRTIGQYESQSADLLITADTDPDWLHATVPFTTALVAVRGLPGAEVIEWGGVILRRQRKMSGNAVTLTLATPECYLDRRYTGAYTTDPGGTLVTSEQNQICADLVTQFAATSQGMPFIVQILNSSGIQRYEEYNDYDDKTVYSNLQTLSGLLHGPEWCAHWQWDRTGNTITPIFYTADRIGQAALPGMGPFVTFDQACLIDGTLDENYSSGAGANDVTATSSGQGLARPQASTVAVSFGDRPRVQYRWQPATSIEDPLTLRQHAQQAETILENGITTITLTVDVGKGPRVGVDWFLGDDVGYELTGPTYPGGFSGVARVLGYETDQTVVTPTLYVPIIR